MVLTSFAIPSTCPISAFTRICDDLMYHGPYVRQPNGSNSSTWLTRVCSLSPRADGKKESDFRRCNRAVCLDLRVLPARDRLQLSPDTIRVLAQPAVPRT